MIVVICGGYNYFIFCFPTDGLAGIVKSAIFNHFTPYGV